MQPNMEKAIERLGELQRTAEKTLEEKDVYAFNQAALVLAYAAGGGDDLQKIQNMYHEFKRYREFIENRHESTERMRQGSQ